MDKEATANKVPTIAIGTTLLVHSLQLYSQKFKSASLKQAMQYISGFVNVLGYKSYTMYYSLIIQVHVWVYTTVGW